MAQQNKWVSASNGHVPPGAVPGGRSNAGEQLYVGRAWHEGDLIPGKIHPSHRSCYVAWGGAEHGVNNYEVLVSNGENFRWCQTGGGRTTGQGDPVLGGHTRTGEQLFVGRAWSAGEVVPGKIQPTHGCLYISQDSREVPQQSYEELLCLSTWVRASNGQVPPMAVMGGRSGDGEPQYVARAHHEGSLTPGKMLPSHKYCYVPWGGKENAKRDYEVLTMRDQNKIKWVPTRGAAHGVYGDLVVGGRDGNEELYIGRAWHQGELTLGKVVKSHQVLYIAWGGKEIPFKEYEIMVFN